MRVLLTGHKGYIGSVMAPMLRTPAIRSSGWTMVCSRDARSASAPRRRPDGAWICATSGRATWTASMRWSTWPSLSNDPLGNLDPDCTYKINHSLPSDWQSGRRKPGCRGSSSHRRAVSMGWPGKPGERGRGLQPDHPLRGIESAG